MFGKSFSWVQQEVGGAFPPCAHTLISKIEIPTRITPISKNDRQDAGRANVVANCLDVLCVSDKNLC